MSQLYIGIGRRMGESVVRAMADGRLRHHEYIAVLLGALNIAHWEATGRGSTIIEWPELKALQQRLAADLHRSVADDR